MSHHHAHHERRIKVALAYKLFGPKVGLSHVGLAIANVNTSKVLRKAGFQSNVWGIANAADLAAKLKADPHDHVMISAPWIQSADLSQLAQEYPETTFAVVSHSNVAFLQADRGALKLIRECVELEQTTHNIRLAGNSERFCEWIRSAFGVPCAFLPNLYYLEPEYQNHIHHQPHGTLRIGIFGATRAQKNLMTCVAAALQVARQLRLPLELNISSGRTEGGGDPILAAVLQMVQGLPGVTIKPSGWLPWTQFRQLISQMNLLISASTTESFHMVSADACAMGVPSVVSEAVTWLPESMKADADDSCDVARVARHILHDPHAAQEGLKALKRYIVNGIQSYTQYISARSEHLIDF